MSYFTTKADRNHWFYIRAENIPAPDSMRPEDVKEHVLRYIYVEGIGPETTDYLIKKRIVRGTSFHYMETLYSEGMVIYADNRGSIPVSECDEDFLKGIFQ